MFSTLFKNSHHSSSEGTEAYHLSDFEKNHNLNLNSCLLMQAAPPLFQTKPFLWKDKMFKDPGNGTCQGKTSKSFQYVFLDFKDKFPCFPRISGESFTEM